ncbi:MAG: hypothetical protein ABSA64_07675 [Sedimentisphaerales bacterium]
MSIKNLPLLLVPFILAGCIDAGDLLLNFKFPVSLHPFFTEKEITFDQQLLGDWQMENSNSNDLYRFEEGEKKSYKILIIEDGKIAASFESYALKLNNKLYLDISPTTSDTNNSPPTNPLLLPTHMLAKIEAIEPNLQVQLLSIPDTLEKDPNFLKHETVDSYIVLTASTKELQNFIKAHTDDKEIFGDPLVLKRLKPNKIVDCNKP